MTIRNWCAPAIFCLLAPTFACAAEPKLEEWVTLFDGSSMDGWEMLKLDPNSESSWTLEDGAMVGHGAASMLYSPEGNYKNFRVKAEVKINDGGNSGMYFRAEKQPSFGSGYEAQINSTHRDPIRTGSIYTRVHVYEELVPPDTWFTQEIEVKDQMYRGELVAVIRVSVNDKLLFELLDYDRQHDGGYFAFQQHDPGSVVMVRKVEVMELPAE